MKAAVLDLQKLKKFDDAKRHQETVWSDDHSRISLFGIKPGQEIITHTHHGSHIWFVVEGIPTQLYPRQGAHPLEQPVS